MDKPVYLVSIQFIGRNRLASSQKPPGSRNIAITNAYAMRHNAALVEPARKPSFCEAARLLGRTLSPMGEITVKEARLILPWNVLTFRLVQDAINNINRMFSGSTVTFGKGNWLNTKTGLNEEEPVAIVDVAYLPNDVADDMLYDVADQFRNATDQTEVYLRYGNGHVQMVSAQSCMDNGNGHEFDWDRLRRELEPNAPDDIGEIVPDFTHPVVV